MTYTLYFVVRKYHIEGREWFDIRVKDSWDSMIHEGVESPTVGMFLCCLWSATQQTAEPGPVWPIAHAFTSLESAEREMRRSQKREPSREDGESYSYHVVDVCASLSL